MKGYCHDVQTTIDEIKERIERLRQKGITDTELQKLLFDEKKKLSRLFITKDYKIILIDYNAEIPLYPLTRAVYLLYLKHPEGIPFKELHCHRSELLAIYRAVSKRVDDDEAKRSIDVIVDPMSNAINVLCSYIKIAFLKNLDVSEANHYFITGEKGTPKKIKINRRLINWELLL